MFISRFHKDRLIHGENRLVRQDPDSPIDTKSVPEAPTSKPEQKKAVEAIKRGSRMDRSSFLDWNERNFGKSPLGKFLAWVFVDLNRFLGGMIDNIGIKIDQSLARIDEPKSQNRDIDGISRSTENFELADQYELAQYLSEQLEIDNALLYKTNAAQLQDVANGNEVEQKVWVEHISGIQAHMGKITQEVTNEEQKQWMDTYNQRYQRVFIMVQNGELDQRDAEAYLNKLAADTPPPDWFKETDFDEGETPSAVFEKLKEKQDQEQQKDYAIFRVWRYWASQQRYQMNRFIKPKPVNELKEEAILNKLQLQLYPDVLTGQILAVQESKLNDLSKTEKIPDAEHQARMAFLQSLQQKYVGSETKYTVKEFNQEVKDFKKPSLKGKGEYFMVIGLYLKIIRRHLATAGQREKAALQAMTEEEQADHVAKAAAKATIEKTKADLDKLRQSSPVAKAEEHKETLIGQISKADHNLERHIVDDSFYTKIISEILTPLAGSAQAGSVYQQYLNLVIEKLPLLKVVVIEPKNRVSTISEYEVLVNSNFSQDLRKKYQLALDLETDPNQKILFEYGLKWTDRYLKELREIVVGKDTTLQENERLNQLYIELQEQNFPDSATSKTLVTALEFISDKSESLPEGEMKQNTQLYLNALTALNNEFISTQAPYRSVQEFKAELKRLEQEGALVVRKIEFDQTKYQSDTNYRSEYNFNKDVKTYLRIISSYLASKSNVNAGYEAKNLVDYAVGSGQIESEDVAKQRQEAEHEVPNSNEPQVPAPEVSPQAPVEQPPAPDRITLAGGRRAGKDEIVLDATGAGIDGVTHKFNSPDGDFTINFPANSISSAVLEINQRKFSIDLLLGNDYLKLVSLKLDYSQDGPKPKLIGEFASGSGSHLPQSVDITGLIDLLGKAKKWAKGGQFNTFHEKIVESAELTWPYADRQSNGVYVSNLALDKQPFLGEIPSFDDVGSQQSK